MRKSSQLDALFPRTRQKILAAALMAPDRWWYPSDLAKYLKVRPSSLQRELASLVAAGILRSRRDGNRVYLQPDPNCPLLPELTGLIAKTAGLVEVLQDALRPAANEIESAFVYGSIAAGEERSESDVDLMVIGKVTSTSLATPLRKAERQLRRPINPSVYTRAELEKKLANGHHFLETVFQGPKLFVIGKEHELAEPATKWSRKTPRHKQSGD